MKVWIARDDDNGQLVVYDHKPIKNWHMGYHSCIIYPFKGKSHIIDERLYPEVTWDNSPIEMDMDFEFSKWD